MSAAERRALGLEFCVVLLVIWVPLFTAGILHRGEALKLDLGREIYGMALQIGFTALPLYLLHHNGESWRHLGIRRCRWWLEALWAILIYAAAWMTYLVLYKLEVQLFGRFVPEDGTSVPRDPLLRILLPAAVLVGAAFEEVFVRGYLWDRIRRLTGSGGFAVFASAAFFALYHPYDIRGMLYVFAFGILFGLLYWRSRSLPRLILAHALFNLSIFSQSA